ncbi:MAG TPA: hypothetical protein PLM75_04125 [bacterium]|nr:hypothetical protein [bacterium]
MKTATFDKFADDYNKWFIENEFVYLTELETKRHFCVDASLSIEIGISITKFAEPLKINYGLEPFFSMIRNIKNIFNISVINGIAENIPFKNNIFKTFPLLTTIYFVDDSEKNTAETKRILKINWQIIIAFLDKESPLGKNCQKNKYKSKFYSKTLFYFSEDIARFLTKHKFEDINIIQTVFGNYKEIKNLQTKKNRFGKCNFIIIKVEKNNYEI